MTSIDLFEPKTSIGTFIPSCDCSNYCPLFGPYYYWAEASSMNIVITIVPKIGFAPICCLGPIDRPSFDRGQVPSNQQCAYPHVVR